MPSPGDLLFVPAGVDDRLEQFSDDLAVWVVFYGPEGVTPPKLLQYQWIARQQKYCQRGTH
jgi:hypothetical protein